MQLMNCTAEGFQPVDKLGGGVPDPKCHFPRPFLDVASKIHTLFQTWPLRNYVILN